MRLFVFAIGGTGARVLRSFTMLMASGIKMNPDIEIVPIIIDMDVNNGDTLRTMDLINKYKAIKDKTYTGPSNDGYFHVPMRTLGSLAADSQNTEATGVKIKDSFQIDFGNITQTFYNYIQASSLDTETMKLLESLFDSSKPSSTGTSSTELHLQLSLGFKGNPNIGSIIFNNIKNTSEYKYFESVFNSGDKILIISSIFGGTGSSGFPVLVKNFRNSDKVDIKNAEIGALVVLPYFKVNTDSNSTIDSNNFNSKTKAALSYYASELDGKINSTYYIGCDEVGLAYANSEGGHEQMNKAHVVEMIAATGIKHFADNGDGGYNYYEFGVPYWNSGSVVDFRHFDEFTKQEVFIPMASFSYFAKLYKQTFRTSKALSAAYSKSLNLTSADFSGGMFAGLTAFVDQFIEWLDELKSNDPGFFPVDINADFKVMIRGMVMKTGLFSKFDDQTFLQNISKFEKQNSSINDRYQRFMKSVFQAIDEVVKEKVKTLPSGENL